MTAKNRAEHASAKVYPDAVLAVTEPKSGVHVSVDPDGSGVTAVDRKGAVLWHVDAIAQTGRPTEGFPVVRHLSITPAGAVGMVIGKHRFIEADLLTGKLTVIGSN
jgi:hypothetical protein